MIVNCTIKNCKGLTGNGDMLFCTKHRALWRGHVLERGITNRLSEYTINTYLEHFIQELGGNEK